jgi:hypothetical protein
VFRLQPYLDFSAVEALEKVNANIVHSASHWRVGPENVGLQKEQKSYLNEVRLCVLGIRKNEVGNTKRQDKIQIIKSFPLALSVSREERCEVLACHQTVQQTSSGNS